MAVKIRLRRTGANNDVSFRVVAVDSRAPREGSFLEALGWYDPKREGVNFSLDADRIAYWQSRGAQLSDTVASLLRHQRKTGAAPADARPQQQKTVGVPPDEMPSEAAQDLAAQSPA